MSEQQIEVVAPEVEETFVAPIRVFRVTNYSGQVMYLTSLEKSVQGIKDALHHLEPMPDSMAVELMGLDGTKVTFTKRQLALVKEQMEHLLAEHADD